MGHFTCCVVNCINTGRNSKCKFYSFPKARNKLNQKSKLINAVRRINSDGSHWHPRPFDRICSDHFIGNKKGNTPNSPNYIPTIFPPIYKVKETDGVASMKRFERFMALRNKRERAIAPINKKEVPATIEAIMANEFVVEDIEVDNVTRSTLAHSDKKCQVETFLTTPVTSNTFICNRYNCKKNYIDVEIQTDVMISSRIIIPNSSQLKEKGCNTENKTFVDKEVMSALDIDMNININMFCGVDSIKNDESMLDLAGVTRDNFQFLLKLISCNTSLARRISKENRLLKFLVKIKTGRTFFAIATIFCVHRSTIARIFISVLADLACNTKDLVFWPDKDTVRATTPQSFHPTYSNTRVIIYCTEFKIEIPSKIDNRIYTYSNYKHGFTAKLLIGVTPSGFISFKYRVAGGRKSDSQITIQSGLLDKLEDGDIVLADKGFPKIQTNINELGKKVIVVMPPFLEKKKSLPRMKLTKRMI